MQSFWPLRRGYEKQRANTVLKYQQQLSMRWKSTGEMGTQCGETH